MTVKLIKVTEDQDDLGLTRHILTQNDSTPWRRSLKRHRQKDDLQYGPIVRYRPTTFLSLHEGRHMILPQRDHSMVDQRLLRVLASFIVIHLQIRLIECRGFRAIV